MSDILIGFVVMARRPGSSWGRRTTFELDNRGKYVDAAIERARQRAVHGMQQWQHLEPHTQFCVRDLVAGSWGHQELFNALPA